ncbi:MAG TPA: cytochrome c oxidase assembly protein, partial [Beutenbergiaceae bacterium]|nr:cytochrome c oxidase assembly protein [Beutenbergiaceae bacterium]
KKTPRPELGPALTIVRVAAGVWAGLALPLAVFKSLDTAGVGPAHLETGAWGYLFSSIYAPGAIIIHVIGAVAVFGIVTLMRTSPWIVGALWVGAWATIAPVAVGHVLVGPNHDFASDMAYFQSLAETTALGLVLMTGAVMAAGAFPTPRLWRRIFVTVTTLLGVTILAEPVIVVVKLAGQPLLATPTGPMLVTKWAGGALLVGALGVGAYLTRRNRATASTLTTLVATGGVGVLAWLGAGGVMLREPPPQYFVPTSISQVFMGYDVDGPATAAAWFTDWRPNLFFLTLAVVGVGGYLAGVWMLRRRGDQWPVGRTIAWILGWAVAVFITSSGMGKHSAPDFATHMLVHMTLNMLVPVFLVLGGVVTLALRVTSRARGELAGIHQWLTWVLNWRVTTRLYNPLFVFGFFIVSYYGLYLSDLFGTLMRFHWGHQLMNMHFLIVGFMFYSLVIGVDPNPRQLPHIGKLGYIVAAMPFHAFFGIVLMTSTSIIGADFYQRLALPWADLARSQYVGGGITWAGGEIPLLIVVIALGVQWARQDSRDARRKDRHLDSGLDPEFEAYNEMLEKLAAREATTAPKESHD